MLTELRWASLSERRSQARLHMFYKMHHGLIATSIPLASKNYQEPTRTENSHAYHLPQSTKDFHLNSFFPRTARAWNVLPETTVQANTLDAFKSALLRN